MTTIIQLYPRRELKDGGVEYSAHFMRDDGAETFIDGSTVFLGSRYEIAEEGDALGEEDSINQALGKLEARVAALEAT